MASFLAGCVQKVNIHPAPLERTVKDSSTVSNQVARRGTETGGENLDSK